MKQMNKTRTPARKLSVERETLRRLDAIELRQVAGGETLRECGATTTLGSALSQCATLPESVCTPC